MPSTFVYPGVDHIHGLATVSFSYQLEILPIAHRFIDLRSEQKQQQQQQHQCRQS